MISTLVLAAALIAPAPQTPPAFRVNANRTLLVNTTPYMPIGARITGNPETIKTALEAGVRDVLLELPADGSGWAAAFAALESAGARYMVAISSSAAPGLNAIIEPDAYRVESVTSGQVVRVPVPDGRDVLAVVASRNDGRILETQRVPVSNGVATVTVRASTPTASVFVAYPIARDLTLPNLHEGLDNHRDTLLAAVRANRPGPGFRGFLNPIGTLPGPALENPSAIPQSPVFRIEFAAYLRAKYNSSATLLRAWGVTAGDITTIEQAARLVPLWANGKGVNVMWDPTTDRTYRTNTRESNAWSDLREVLLMSAVRRTANLANALRAETGQPVIQDWDGWNGLTSRTETALNGIGVPIIPGPQFRVTAQAAGAASTALRTPGSWLVATQVSFDAEALDTTIDNLQEIGFRALFIRANDKDQFAAIARYQNIPFEYADLSPRTLYYPLEAADPAVPMLLPGRVWWLPAPVAGRRLNLGDNFSGYQLMQSGGPVTVLWATSERNTPVTLIANDPRALTISNPDGTALAGRVVRRGVEFVLPSLPILVKGSPDAVVPNFAFEEAAGLATVLVTNYGGRVDPSGGEKVAVTEATSAFDSNPGESTSALWTLVDRLAPRASPYVWLDAINAASLEIGGLVQRDGTRNRTVLRLAGRMGADEGPGRINWTFMPRRSADHEIWVAAAIPPAARGRVSVRIGERIFRIESSPVSPYGDGFGWYRVGNVTLTPGEQKCSFEYISLPGAAVLVDALVFSPEPFRPNGPRAPYEWILRNPPPIPGEEDMPPPNAR